MKTFLVMLVVTMGWLGYEYGCYETLSNASVATAHQVQCI